MSARKVSLLCSLMLLSAAPARAGEGPVEGEVGGPMGSVVGDDGAALVGRREALYRTFKRAAKSAGGDLEDVGAGSLSIVSTMLTGISLVPAGIAVTVDGERPALGVGVLVGGGLALGAGVVGLALGSGSRYRDVVADMGLHAGFASAWLGIALSGRTIRDDGSSFGADRVHLGPLSHAIAGFATTGLVLAEGLSRPRLASATLQRDARLLAGTRSYLAMGEDEIGRIEGDLAVTASRWPGWVRAMPYFIATGASLGVALGERDGDERLLAVTSGVSSLLMAFLAAAQDPDLLVLYREELESGGLEVELVLSGSGVGLSGRF